MASVSSATSTEAILASLNASRAQADEVKAGAQDRFLKLLVTQLKNQDPLNPMDNAQVTSQMAQISTVDGIEKLNRTLQALVSSATDSQAVQAAALVGHGVLVEGRGMNVVDGTGIAGVELAAPADSVVAIITDPNGLVVRNLDLGARAAGSHGFRWDGKDDAGVAVADGAYRIQLKALRAGEAVTATALELGVVSGVTRSAAGYALDLGSLGSVQLGAVKQII